MSKIEANKFYALVTSNRVLEVIKVLPSDSARFANFFRVESISLRHYEFGIMQVAYMHKDVTRDYVEIPEEEYVEAPALNRPTTAQIVDAQKAVTESEEI